MPNNTTGLARLGEVMCAVAPEARIAIVTHGYVSTDAAEQVARTVGSFGLERLVVAICIPMRAPLHKFRALGIAEWLKIVDVSRLLAEAIVPINLGASVNLPGFRGLGRRSTDRRLAPRELAACNLDATAFAGLPIRSARWRLPTARPPPCALPGGRASVLGSKRAKAGWQRPTGGPRIWRTRCLARGPPAPGWPQAMGVP